MINKEVLRGINNDKYQETTAHKMQKPGTQSAVFESWSFNAKQNRKRSAWRTDHMLAGLLFGLD